MTTSSTPSSEEVNPTPPRGTFQSPTPSARNPSDPDTAPPVEGGAPPITLVDPVETASYAPSDDAPPDAMSHVSATDSSTIAHLTRELVLNLYQARQGAGRDQLAEILPGVDDLMDRLLQRPDFPTAVPPQDIQLDLTTPVRPSTRRSSMDAVRVNALRQSNLFGIQGGGKVYPIPSSTSPDAAQPALRAGSVKVGGRKLTLNSTPVSVDEFSSPRTWDKTKRSSLADDIRQLFIKGATGYVLSKTNKLSVQSFKIESDGKLEHIRNLQSQLKLLQAHVVNYDIDDIFTIVVPYDVHATSDLAQAESFNLFQDFSKLHATVVANSNAWYNRWVQDSYVQENMSYTFTLLQNNTEDTLWAKCLEEYDEFHPCQRGGPLMLYLLLRRIQNSSESSIDHIKQKVKTLKISKIPGEDVDVAVSLIKSTHDALKCASTDARSYVPDDFVHTVLQVLQTSSVSAFNKAFSHELTEILHKADKFGGQPDWPQLTEITTLATNTYNRLKSADKWHVSSESKGRALNATPSQSGRRCFNCGDPDHMLGDCPKPPDDTKIAAARKAFREANPFRSRSSNSNSNSNSGNSRGRPRSNKASSSRRKTDDQGRPLIQNKNGAYVVDSRRLREREQKAATLELIKSTEQAMASLDNAKSNASATSSLTQSSGCSGFQAQSERCRAAVLRTIKSYE